MIDGIETLTSDQEESARDSAKMQERGIFMEERILALEEAARILLSVIQQKASKFENIQSKIKD